MQKQAPTLGRLVVMVGFAFSCFGLLLFLWVSFGGPIPLKPKGYRFELTFREANQLATEADVRISGVPVGKVKRVVNAPDGTTQVAVEMDARYAPINKNSRAILRQKTLLGETYVELSPGSPDGGKLAENAALPPSATQDTVELDEITRGFDAKTRRAFQVWQQSQAEALAGRGADLNDALGSVEPFAQDARALFETLNSQSDAVQQLVRDGGVVFNALSEQRGQLRGLISNGNKAFETTANRNAELKDAIRALPTFEVEATKTLQRLNRFSEKAQPLVTQLTPAFREAGPTVQALADVAPSLDALLTGAGPLLDAAKDGLPATQTFVRELGPFLGAFDPALRQLNPLLSFVGAYRSDVRAFLANTAAASTFFDSERIGDGSRARFYAFSASPAPLSAESLAAYPRRLGANRNNPYPFPDAFRRLAQGLGVFDTRSCAGPTPKLSDDLAAYDKLSPDGATLRKVLQETAFGGESGVVPAPPCTKQQQYTTSGAPADFPQVPATSSGAEVPKAP